MKEKPGRVLGRAKTVGDAMTYHVLAKSSTVIQLSVLHLVEYSEMKNQQVDFMEFEKVNKSREPQEFKGYIPYIQKCMHEANTEHESKKKQNTSMNNDEDSVPDPKH